MMKKWKTFALIVSMTLVLAWWVWLLISNTRAFFRGDRTSGVVALIILGLMVVAAGVGITTYRRYRLEWKNRSAQPR